ncbi:prepilin-type N-terminal cleavage/methylation domain-containing protein [Salmonella enterica subsp. enterica]|nr:prepilin-type N-terminal cleavage/methylation domain-containing protein [Salmonella enterica subsp. enterica serovar Sandiego]
MRKLQKGLSLIEVALVLALSAVVVAGALIYYSYAAESYKMQKSIEELQSINATVQSLYANHSISAGGFGFAQSIIKASRLNTTIQAKVEKISFPIGGVLELWGSGKIYYAEIQKFSIPECIRMSTLNLGTSMLKSPEVIKGNEEPQQTNFSHQKAAELCKTGTKIRFTMRT